MKRVAKSGFLVLLLSAEVALAQKASSRANDQVDQGKSIFVSRCAKCHDADANRKLPDGTTLLERLTKSQDSKALLATRLKHERERDAVMVYLQPLIDRSRSGSN
jgi:cytochrome c553